MPTTPTYALRYPAATDPADVPVDMQELATDVEAALVRAPSASATFPTSPVNGQIHRYLVTANGPVWTFVYLSASAAPKWHFLGGHGMFVRIISSGAIANAAFQPLGPELTLPLAGNYRVQFGGHVAGTVATAIIHANFSVAGALPPNDDDSLLAQPPGANYVAAGMGSNYRDVTGLAANTRIEMVGKCNTGTATWNARYLLATPIRVNA